MYKIADTYHAWRGEPIDDADRVDEDGQPLKSEFAEGYQDIAGFCKSAKRDEVEKHGFVLTPGRYVGAAEEEDDGDAFDDKMKRLTTTLKAQMDESQNLDAEIAKQLAKVGYGF